MGKKNSLKIEKTVREDRTFALWWKKKYIDKWPKVLNCVLENKSLICFLNNCLSIYYSKPFCLCPVSFFLQVNLKKNQGVFFLRNCDLKQK
jgi:hypothetical protein